MARPAGIPMSEEHKAALLHGRELANQVKPYLQALAATGPKHRGRQRTAESIDRDLAKAQAALQNKSAISKLKAHQAILNLMAEAEAMNRHVDITDLQKDFIGAVVEYSERNGISPQAWLQMGVPKSVLKEAGMATRGRTAEGDVDSNFEDDEDEDSDDED